MKKNILITVLFFLCIHTCCAQYTIKGKVTDEQQNPLQGVSITIEKKLSATFSDSAGNYTLSFSSFNAILTFTHIGYQPVMLKIKEGNVQTVTLLRSNIFLSETVVVLLFNKNFYCFLQLYAAALALHNIARFAFKYNIATWAMLFFVFTHLTKISRKVGKTEINFN